MPLPPSPPPPPLQELPPPPPPRIPLPPIPTDLPTPRATPSPPGAVRKALGTAPNPETFIRSIRDRSREQYQRIREKPSFSDIGSIISTKSAPAGRKSEKPIPPLISTFSPAKGRSLHSVPNSPIIENTPDMGQCGLPSSHGRKFEYSGSGSASGSSGYGGRGRFESMQTGCLAVSPHPGGRYLGDLKQKVKGMFKGFHVSVSISFKGEEKAAAADPLQRPRKKDITLRIKNNKTGCCLFEIERVADREIATPVENLKQLFPHDKNLPKSLNEWNRHFQNPPPHWVVNFIPRAYLRRGYFLAEDVCEYFLEHPDGIKYRIEYEPIGHEWCLVGTVIPRQKRPRRNWGEEGWGQERGF